MKPATPTPRLKQIQISYDAWYAAKEAALKSNRSLKDIVEGALLVFRNGTEAGLATIDSYESRKKGQINAQTPDQTLGQ